MSDDGWKLVTVGSTRYFEKEPTATVVPAQPGFSVGEFIDDENDVYGFAYTPVLAWLVEVTPIKTGDEVEFSTHFPKPVVLDILPKRYVIRDPLGKIRDFDQQFDDEAAALEKYRKDHREAKARREAKLKAVE